MKEDMRLLFMCLMLVIAIKTGIFLILIYGGTPVKSPALFVISPKIAQDFNF